MATVGDVLSSALRLAGVLAAEESLSADQSENGIETLNEILAMWGTTRMNRSGNQQLTFTLTDESVTFGTGGDVSTRIQGASSVIVRSGGPDYTLREISVDDYATIPLKSTGGTPEVFAWTTATRSTRCNLPGSFCRYAIARDAVVAMAEYSSVSDTVNLPPETRRRCVRRWRYIFALNMASSRLPRWIAMSRQSQAAMRRACRASRAV